MVMARMGNLHDRGFDRSVHFADDWDVREQRLEERAAQLECKDDDEKCQEWAAAGQCQSNRLVMVSLQ